MPLLLLLALSGCLITLPPSRTEVAQVATPGGTRTRLATGAHLGSALPTKATRVDVGVGVLYESEGSRGGRESAGETGAYADVGVAVVRREHARVLLGLRGERHWRADTLAVGKVRLDLELLAHGQGGGAEGGACGAFIGGWYGQRGLAVYAEAGRAFADPGQDHANGWVASVGFAARMPAVAGLLIPGSRSGGCSSGSSGMFDFSGSSGSSGSSSGS